VAQTPERGFDAADQNGNILVSLADQIAVAYGCIVRSFSDFAAGGIGIGFTAMLGDGIMVYHGVHVTAGYQKAKSGFAIDIDGFGVFPVGLRNDTHRIAMAFQDSADNGMSKRRMIYISIADHIYKVAALPATIDHILSAKGKKIHILPPDGHIFVIIADYPP
jgi:hypothetical protein